MKKSEITSEANKYVKDVFKGVILSEKKEDWKGAIVFLTKKIYLLEVEKSKKAVTDTALIKKIWVAREARTILLKKFGAKFILPLAQA